MERPHGFGRSELIHEVDIKNLFHGMGNDGSGSANSLKIEASVTTAGFKRFGSHAAFTDDDPYSLFSNHGLHVGFFANGGRRTCGHNPPRAIGVLLDNGTTVEEGAVMEVYRRCMRFREEFVKAVTSRKH